MQVLREAPRTPSLMGHREGVQAMEPAIEAEDELGSASIWIVTVNTLVFGGAQVKGQPLEH